LSPHEVSRSAGVAAPMARYTFAARSRAILLRSVTPPQRGSGLSAPTRHPLPGADRAHADRLCARRLSARLADAVGLLFATAERCDRWCSGGPAEERPPRAATLA